MREMWSEDAASASSQPSGPFPVSNATHSYWRSQLHPIDSHRTTEELPSECDICIIGAGMSGAALAYHLTKDLTPEQTPTIVMLEAREVCSGATGRNGGHVKMKTDTMLNIIKRDGLEAATQVREHVHEQIYAIKDVVEREGLDCEFELRRSFDVFLTEAEAQKAREEYEACRIAGQKWTREVDWIGPGFAENITSVRGARGAFSSPCCSLWPYKFVSQLLAMIVNSGVLNLQTNTPVTNEGPTTTSTGTTANLVHTPRGSITARKLIFATNGYTAGISPAYTGLITPVKGTSTHLTPLLPVNPHLSHTYNITYGPSKVDYLNPRPDGGIVVGGGSWTFRNDRSLWHNNWDDSTLFPTPATESHFSNLMERHFHGWEASGTMLESIWTGIMGYTPDEWPHVGAVPGQEGRQWIMAGFNGGGMATIWLTAKGLAGMVSNGLRYGETRLPGVFETTAGRLEELKGM